jgi:hypothetical protein
MNPPTESQRAALRCFKNQFVTANGELRNLIARRREFEFALHGAQKRATELQSAASLDDAEILALVVAERKTNLVTGFLSQSAPEVTRLEIFLINELNKFGEFFSELHPNALNKPASQLPTWAGEGCGVVDRAKFAVEEIDRLLE